MARKLRVEYSGAIYHRLRCELQRDKRHELRLRREPIFRDHTERQRFVETLAEVCAQPEPCSSTANERQWTTITTGHATLSNALRIGH